MKDIDDNLDIEKSITNSLLVNGIIVNGIKLNEKPKNPIKYILIVSSVILTLLGVIYCIIYFV